MNVESGSEHRRSHTSFAQRVLRHPVLLGLSVVLAGVVAIPAGYRVDLGSMSLTPRSTSYGFAAVDLLLDSGKSSLSNSQVDLVPLGTRAQVFATVLTSDPVRSDIARRMKVDPSEISQRVLKDGLTVGDNLDAIDQLNATTRARTDYRLTYKAETRGPQGGQNLPLIAVTGEAPTEQLAKRLVDSAAISASRYSRVRAQTRKVNRTRATQINALGGADAATINTGVNKAAVLGTGLLTLIGLMVVIALYDRLRSRRR